MPAPRPEVADLLEVDIPPGGKVIVASDLHLPPARTDVSGRCCETLSRQLDSEDGPLTVVLAGDVVELLGFPEATATDILRAHEDLCAALAGVAGRGGQVIYAIGNHDGDLAWDVKAAGAVREMTGARLCLEADLILPGGRRVRVEHGHQLDPYNCFCDPRNSLDTPLGHHIVREVIPRIEWLGRGWVDGAHEMADPTDFPSFIGSRLVYRKFGRRLWWLIAIPLAILILVRIPVVTSIRSRYPDTQVWVHRGEILGWGALADLIMLAVVVAILARRAWVSVSALALERRGYEQNHAARQRATDLIADGYHGFLSGHTHHPELTDRGWLLRQLRVLHLGGGGDRRPVRAAPGLVRNQQVLGGVAGDTCGWSPPGSSCRARPRWSGSSPGAATRTRTRRPASPPGRPDPTGPRRTRRPRGRSPAARCARALDGAAAGLSARAASWPGPRISKTRHL